MELQMRIVKHYVWFLLLLASAVSAQGPPGPGLVLDGTLSLSAGVAVNVPVDFTSHGHAITAVAFSLDIDVDQLGFDPADGDGDGRPDTVSFPFGEPSLTFVRFNAADIDGELDIVLGNLSGQPLTDGLRVVIELLPTGGGQVAEFVRYSQDPPPSFGNAQGQDVSGTAVVTVGEPGACVTGLDTMCLNDRRFRLRIRWRDFAGNTGSGRVVPGVGSADSGLFYFFSANNWEMLVKVLDGCAINDHFWLLAAATTNVEYTLEVTDTETDTIVQYFNPLGNSADALVETSAFASCPGRELGPSSTFIRLDSQATESVPMFAGRSLEARAKQGDCRPSDTELCVTGDRFRVEVEWRDFAGNFGSAKVVPLAPSDSGLFYFFNFDNWEMLVKVLDGCGINSRFWVFAAAATNVEYTLQVTDTETGEVKTYINPLGNLAAAITDTGAFATCP